MKAFKFDIQRFVETINGTAGHDNISVTASQQFINALGGNDTIHNNTLYVHYNGVTISAGDGSDSILSGYDRHRPTNNISIIGGTGNDWVSIVGSNATVSGDDGDDYICASLNSNSISGDTGDDYLVGYGKNTTILGETGNDTVYVSESDYAFIEGGDGADSIAAGGIKSYNPGGGIGVTINGGYGNDYIRAKDNTNGLLIGSYGADTIIALGSPQNLTIYSGWGNDSISLESSAAALISLDYSDDSNIIHGFNEDDTLQISAGTYSTTSTGNDVIVNINPPDDATNKYYAYATLVGATGYSLNIQGTYGEEYTPDPTPTIEPVTVTPEPTPAPTPSAYEFYSGRTATISAVTSSYSGYEKINFHTDFRGLGIDGNNFRIYSSTGSLTIQNIRGKIISYGDAGGNVIAYSYVSNQSGTIDGRSYSQYEVIIGADNADNQIYAGNGGSSLWGGIGGNDILTGNDGYDEIFYTQGSASDTVQNVGDNDVINLLGVSLSQITNVSVTYSEINADFADGGHINVKSSAAVGFKLEGVTYVANRSNGTWSTK